VVKLARDQSSCVDWEQSSKIILLSRTILLLLRGHTNQFQKGDGAQREPCARFAAPRTEAAKLERFVQPALNSTASVACG
jgi:hypothetical protein